MDKVMINILFGKMKFIGLLVSLGLIVYGIVMKVKWHYYPLCILVVLYTVLIVLNYFKIFNPRTSASKWLMGLGIFLILSSVILLLVFPIEKLPIPTGHFEVGTRIYNVEDESRSELYSENDNDVRKIQYQSWYPTETTKGYKKQKWITEGRLLTRHLARSMHMPSFMLDHTAQIDSNSFFNAPISEALDRYPVIIISHGWKGFRELHTDVAEELASHGFIVLSIDHSYGAQAVKFDDDTVAYLNKDALPRKAKPTEFIKAANLLAATFGDDVESVLNQLEDTDFHDRLDMGSMGVLGHSTGGGGDVYSALEDGRIKALIGMDAWVEPIKTENLKQGLSIPSLFLRSEQWDRGPNNMALNTLLANSRDATLVQMDQTTHVDFTMTYMYSPLSKYVGFTGKLGGRYSAEIQRKLILNFFDQNLRSDNEDADNSIEDIVEQYDHMKIIKQQ